MSPPHLIYMTCRDTGLTSPPHLIYMTCSDTGLKSPPHLIYTTCRHRVNVSSTSHIHDVYTYTSLRIDKGYLRGALYLVRLFITMIGIIVYYSYSERVYFSLFNDFFQFYFLNRDFSVTI